MPTAMQCRHGSGQYLLHLLSQFHLLIQLQQMEQLLPKTMPILTPRFLILRIPQPLLTGTAHWWAGGDSIMRLAKVRHSSGTGVAGGTMGRTQQPHAPFW